jgi:hypothetical protein
MTKKNETINNYSCRVVGGSKEKSNEEGWKQRGKSNSLFKLSQ